MKSYLTLFLIAVPLWTNAQLSDPKPFLTPSAKLKPRILNHSETKQSEAPLSLVRLPNNKLALMVRENGALEPFFIKAIETGYWDTRYEPDTDYHRVFEDMRVMGANTAYIMIHWEDIEPRDNQFDFHFTDSLVDIARKHDLKINWVLFLHAQSERVPSLSPHDAWTFHLDDRDSSNYAMQWVKRKDTLYTKIEDVLRYGVRPLHAYGHPEVFMRIRRMLYNLGSHYREDNTVIGVQVGNEEGFSFLDESDFNPVTAGLFEQWKLKTNKSDYALFKKDAIDWWWSEFTSAYREGDPYKLLSFNLDAGQAEAGDPGRVRMTGTSAATYGDGNLDVIGTMLYKEWGYKALEGLDQCYGNAYNYELPVLIPSEIGIGRFNPTIDFRHFIIQTLERAAQGFGVYCYGEVREEYAAGKDKREELIRMFDVITANEKVIYGGLPGPGLVRCMSPDSVLQISHLNLNGENTLAFLYYPQNGTPHPETLPFNPSVQLKSTQTGKFKIRIYKNGVLDSERKYQLTADKVMKLEVPEMDLSDVLFVSMDKE